MESFINFYLCINKIYITLCSFIYNKIGPVHFIYHYDGMTKKNVTLQCLLGMEIENGTFHIHTKTDSDTNDIVLDGAIDDVINYINNYEYYLLQTDNSLLKRKNITILYYDEILNINFQLLDNHKKLLNDTNDFILTTNLKTLLYMLADVKCTHVNIITILPFQKIVYDIDHITINMIYE